MNYEINCPVCNKNKFENLVLLKNYPVSNVGLTSSKEEALKANVYDMNICMCKNCSHIYNRTPINIEYKKNNMATYFTNFKQEKYTKDLASKIVKKYNIINNTILEIGSGDATFLKELNKSNNNCIGYEPSYFKLLNKKNLKIINDYFDPTKDLESNYDLIVIRHVLEHFDNPFMFLKNILDHLQNQPKIFIEVPNIQPTIDNYRINDFIHEHISHFSFYSLNYLLNSLNLKILEIYGTNNDENIVAMCELDKTFSHAISKIENISFGFNESINVLQEAYKNILLENEIICIWGAEGRGASFLKIIKDISRGDEIIIDSDEKKFGKFIPSIGLKISYYKEIINLKIDVIIITTSLGKDNIIKEIRDNNIEVNKIYVISESGLREVK